MAALRGAEGQLERRVAVLEARAAEQATVLDAAHATAAAAQAEAAAGMLPLSCDF